MARSPVMLLVGAALVLAACAPADPPASAARSTSTASQALVASNGDNLNGDNLNGDNLNGDGLNGDGLNGTGLGFHLVSVNYAGASRYGLRFDSVSIAGSQLVGRRASATFAGQQMVGASFQGTSDTGASVSVFVTRVTQEAPPNADSWDYEVWYADPVHGTSWPLCRDATGNALPAFAVNGHWSYAQGVPGGGAKSVDGATFTFACKGQGAIGKCISPLGYKPWASFNGVSLDRFHQTCVRLIRADFCGDGSPHTQNGNVVDLYDALGLQQDTEDDWLFEAEWDENGARCFNPLNRSRAAVSCYAERASATCGSLGDFNAGTLMMDEVPASETLP